MILIILLACIVFTFYSAPGDLAGNTTNSMNMTKNLTGVQSVPVPIPTLTSTPVPHAPTPPPAPQYVTIKPVVTVAASPHITYDTAPFSTAMLYNTKEYTSIYKNNLSYSGYAYNISFDLKSPPMVIRYTVIPLNITDSKWFSPRDNLKLINSTVVKRPTEDAYFTIKIHNNGMLMDTLGWGTIYGTPLTPQIVVIRDTGMSDIEFSGEQVSVTTEIFVKKEGNIPV